MTKYEAQEPGPGCVYCGEVEAFHTGAERFCPMEREHTRDYKHAKLTCVRFHCRTTIGAPDDKFALLVGTTGAIIVEGPWGRVATLSEAESREFVAAVLARLDGT